MSAIPRRPTGLQAGDVIIAVNDRKITGSADLRNHVRLAQVGSHVEIDTCVMGCPKR
ncbi:PDZ domain-containing protein [Rhizobium giardinii]|uniref:PDZ domain-containing protein n=1 Tax=Rhizobium giardinii TaxID=56731 RepID=UPI00039CA068|nr:PDZ domain-containing protein [Rhizobium giardinii]